LPVPVPLSLPVAPIDVPALVPVEVDVDVPLSLPVSLVIVPGRQATPTTRASPRERKGGSGLRRIEDLSRHQGVGASPYNLAKRGDDCKQRAERRVLFPDGCQLGPASIAEEGRAPLGDRRVASM
ncbi:MAG: hypothetical protein KC420_17255, partial [Myxococcales bacterium]|nr:hypothetical protein [Myxococcales bacterium]